jgi:hypothetical protein
MTPPDQRTADALVRALLAIASAINRVADQLENLARRARAR